MKGKSSYFLLTFTCFVIGIQCQFSQFKESHQPQVLSNSELQYLSSLDDDEHFKKTLDRIIIPRVVGTKGHEKVFKYIVNELENLNWFVDVDEFDQVTPILGTIRFKNIVATPHPNAERYLVLACHYDSKYFPNEEFLGATDSAAPCAMMLNLAYTLRNDLNDTISNVGLKFVFFDGEEAIQEWTDQDSIYGARHLAEVLENDLRLSRITGEVITGLHRFDMLVLLDLLGAKNPTFYNYFPETHRWFARLYQIEKKLKRKDLLLDHTKNYFQTRPAHHMIQDDHLPFLRRNVPVLHLITTPFPREWHTLGDNKNIIDQNTCHNLNLILRVFVSEYLHLLRSADGNSRQQKEESNTNDYLQHYIIIGLLSLVMLYLIRKIVLRSL